MLLLINRTWFRVRQESSPSEVDHGLASCLRGFEATSQPPPRLCCRATPRRTCASRAWLLQHRGISSLGASWSSPQPRGGPPQRHGDQARTGDASRHGRGRGRGRRDGRRPDCQRSEPRRWSALTLSRSLCSTHRGENILSSVVEIKNKQTKTQQNNRQRWFQHWPNWYKTFYNECNMTCNYNYTYKETL